MDPKEIREQAIREAKCNLILDAAREIFAQKGFHETRLDEIALSAGFSKASLYNYYPDKESIFLSLAIREYERVIQAIKSVIKPDLNLEENLRAILKTVFGLFSEHLAFIVTTTSLQKRFHMQAEMCKHEELMAQMHSGVDDVLATLEQIVRTARSRSEIKSPIPDRTIARFIGSLIRGAMLDWKMDGKIGDVDETVTHMLAFIGRGIGIESASSNSL